MLRFEVADTGIGIAADRMEDLFSPFTQVDGSSTRQYGGTGLGLAISRQLVSLMGGVMTVKSEHGRGSRFNFTAHLKPLAPARLVPELVGRAVRIVVGNPDQAEALAWLVATWGGTPSVWRGVGTTPDWAAEFGGEGGLLVLDGRLLDADGERVARSSGASKPRGALLVGLNRRGESPPPGLVAVTRPVHGSSLMAALLGQVAKAPFPTEAGGRVLEDRSSARNQISITTPDFVDRPRVLVVEDNPVNQRVARALLAKLGLKNVDVVENGRLGVEAAVKNVYDLVLMDCQMPEMDGYRATEMIRDPVTGVANPRVPIVAMTANAVMGDRERCIAAGMDDYLAKPVQIEVLRQMVGRYLPLT